MSKKDIQRNPVPEDPVQCYSMMVHVLALRMGIDEIPEIYDYVEMLEEACARHSFEQTHPISPRKKEEKEKRKFITVFRTLYLQLLDYEYERPVTGVDAKMMKQTTRALKEKGFEVDEYLKWVFEVFLPDNAKFCPPSPKWACSAFVFEKFMYEHRAVVKEKHEKELHRKEGLAIINRARVLMREAGAVGDGSAKEKIKEILLDYRNGRIMLGGFRAKIEELERLSRNRASQEGPVDG